MGWGVEGSEGEVVGFGEGKCLFCMKQRLCSKLVCFVVNKNRR